ncbi:MAG: hypothetical protein WBN29_18255 [Polyangiales bacterium]
MIPRRRWWRRLGWLGRNAGSDGTNGGPSGSPCEAICLSSCVLQGVDPETAECLTQCQATIPMFDDNCGAQADAYLGCLEGVNCNTDASDCQAQAIAWATCLAGVL